MPRSPPPNPPIHTHTASMCQAAAFALPNIAHGELHASPGEAAFIFHLSGMCSLPTGPMANTPVVVWAMVQRCRKLCPRTICKLHCGLLQLRLQA